ncbi:7295_t:CDS:1, partial [Gigaspora margarita]
SNNLNKSNNSNDLNSPASYFQPASSNINNSNNPIATSNSPAQSNINNSNNSSKNRSLL